MRGFIIIISISLTKFQQDNSKKKKRGPIYYPLTLVTIISYYPLCILPFCCGCRREDSHVVILSGNIIAPICFYLSSFPPLYFIIQEFTRHVYCCSVACSPVSQLHVIAFKWSSQMTNKKTINSFSNKTKLMHSCDSSENWNTGRSKRKSQLFYWDNPYCLHLRFSMNKDLKYLMHFSDI